MATRSSLMDFQTRGSSRGVDEHRGVFVIEPLDRGFGYTFGNSLRRVLLSSLEGAAVTAVKIEGVAHEFTTLPGVREDVTDIILNLKNLICVLHGESPEIEVHIAKKGAGIVTAADIEAPADLEILNPELELAHLADKGKLEMTLTIGRGRGYVPAELNRGPGDDDRRHPDRLDLLARAPRRLRGRGRPRRSAHRLRQAPPRRDDGRLDRAEGRDRRGGRDPDPASSRSSPTSRRSRASARPLPRPPPRRPSSHGMENFPIEELELGVRSYNCLKRVGIETIGDLTSKSENELAAIPNFGRSRSRRFGRRSPRTA